MTDDRVFRVDNFIIQHASDVYAARRKPQPALPGFAPLAPFDFWATLGCYSLLNPKKPTAPVFTKLSVFLETLQFSRVINDAAGGYDNYPSDAYEMVEQALERLSTHRVYLRGVYHLKSKKRGRPRKEDRQIFEYYGYIIPEFEYRYRDDVTPPDQVADSDRVDVNRAIVPAGEYKRPVWKLTNGPKPIGIQFSLASRLVQGLTGEEGNIGATIMPFRIFTLRPTFGPYPLATRLLVWTLRQVRPQQKIGLDKLVDAVKVEGRNRSRNRKTILEYLDLIQQAGVIGDLSFDEATGFVTFTKAPGWFFPVALLDDPDAGPP